MSESLSSPAEGPSKEHTTLWNAEWIVIPPFAETKTVGVTPAPRLHFLHGAGGTYTFKQEQPLKRGDYLAYETVHPRGESTYQRVSTVETFATNLDSIGSERQVLRLAVANLWRMYRFNQNYVGFLSGGVTQEDFEDVVQRLAVDPVAMSDADLKKAVQFVLPLIHDEELTPGELASVLNVEEAQLKLSLD